MSKQDRQGARTPAQLEQEYKFGETFAKAFGLAEDARMEAEKAGKAAQLAQSEVVRLDDRISLTVTATNAAQDTADKAKEEAEKATAEIISKSAALSVQAGEIEASVKTLRSEIGTKAEQSQVNEITEHFRFGEDGLTITNSATGMGINVSEQQVAFTGGQDPTTIITPNAMETTNLTVGTRLDLGDFSLIPRTNKNLSLRWTGG